MNYFLSTNGDVTGPFPREELERSYRVGEIASHAQICEEGQESWMPISMLYAHADGQNPGGAQLATVPGGGSHVHYHIAPPKSPGVAILLEVLPALMMQTFGIGNLYAGNTNNGLILMFTYWLTCIVNFFLIFVVIGIITWPLTFIGYLIWAIISAQKSAEYANAVAAQAYGNRA
ncbi:MAG: DUF4339 domain-containing protein [Verrucomicrobiales bacterium]|nr:DUF4339 domain-containing protein [Verrucomicrobiales bacterium]